MQERHDAWRIARKSLSLYDQTYQLKEIFAAGDTEILSFNAAWHVLNRVNKTFYSFFRRVKRGEKAGYPRFKSPARFDAFDWQVQAHTKPIKNGKLQIPKMGAFKLKLHRPINGEIKHCAVKRRVGKWYVCLSVECAPVLLPESAQTVGIDLGLSSFITLSDGQKVGNPRFYKEAQKRLRVAQRRVTRRKKGSAGRRKAVRLLQRAHLHVQNQHADFHHKVSSRLIENYGLIVAEDLNVQSLAKTHLAKSVRDVGWGAFLDMIAYKAENAGRNFFRVNPRGTSQRCLGCGERQEKVLSERTHKCRSCGLILDRDHNAAINILRAGEALVASTCPIAESVATESQ